MFEKSLVDLIRGMRGHKGRENEYIQTALRECRSEIRSQDMDLKATALLKIIYLEMFGNEMTWAAFNVLEVMSSAKHVQKRVGYLAAAQSFGPETEVLMLAENLLKKDLASSSIPTLSLPLTTLPHVVTSSLALSILTDLLPRLSHSQPHVRKKTISTLYRLALIYPETLRVAWPKIKERLLDEDEDSSVTAATVNVVCELGWRRPQDFLPLAPRLFTLLVDGNNNWMAIKIIKLFAVLTPLEPRLVKKLVRPLTNLIQSTTAMSLLYECVSGIIQGGILDGAEAGVNVEEVADLCITKLRGMIVLDGDPNLKYVALLAFNKIVSTHPLLVAEQQDVILKCLDDPDISIRLQALELATGMVSSDTLQSVVEKLMRQLTNAADEHTNAVHSADRMDNTDLEQRLVADTRSSEMQALPNEYRAEIINKILDMSSANTYANIVDFEWYIDVLVRLIRQLPARSSKPSANSSTTTSLASKLALQLLDIAVRVKELRQEVVRVAESIVSMSTRTSVFASHETGLNEVLDAASWICGEYATYLATPYEVVNSCCLDTTRSLAARTIMTILQMIPKVFARISADANKDWNKSRKSTLSFTLARVTTFLETLSTHPNLEVQERSVEFLELLKLGSEALTASTDDALEAPLLLSGALHDLFSGSELNPVSAAAQRKVPLPDDLDLDTPINSVLNSVLQASQLDDVQETDDEESLAFNRFYHERDNTPAQVGHTFTVESKLRAGDAGDVDEPQSYQNPESAATTALRKAERAARTRDDPFYIPSGSHTPSNELSSAVTKDQEALDVDSIPIIDLKIDASQLPEHHARPTKIKKKPKRKFAVTADESIDSAEPQLSSSYSDNHASRPLHHLTPSTSSYPSSPARIRSSRNLLTVNSATLNSVSLTDSPSNSRDAQIELERRIAEEAEMAAALKEIERKRLELAREEERSQTQIAEGVSEEGVVVRRKKKKPSQDRDGDDEVEVVVKKAKKKKKSEQDVGGGDVVKKKKKKKKVEDEQVTEDVGGPVETSTLT